MVRDLRRVASVRGSRLRVEGSLYDGPAQIRRDGDTIFNLPAGCDGMELKRMSRYESLLTLREKRVSLLEDTSLDRGWRECRVNS